MLARGPSVELGSYSPEQAIQVGAFTGLATCVVYGDQWRRRCRTQQRFSSQPAWAAAGRRQLGPA
jgi:hypothetical protein